ncbi:MAG: 4Fe-4S dicluster domain-containing protein [Geobacter sp.]|nr:4Fe-4S dicluster domain-containing protein [Geobacter sp.]
MEAAGTATLGESTVNRPFIKRCSGCGRCVAACRRRLHSLETVNNRKISVKKSLHLCDQCRQCVSACPLQLLGDDQEVISHPALQPRSPKDP